MKGGFLHNRVLLQPFEDYFRALGAEVFLEHPIEPGRSPRSVDLFALYRSDRIVIEAELTRQRVTLDIEKARLVSATLLLLVMPNAAAARAAAELALPSGCRSGIPSSEMPLWILPLGPALRRVREWFPLPSNPIHPRMTNQNCRSERSPGGPEASQ